MKGSRPPPCAFFTLTKIDEEHAVIFGGLFYHLYIADVHVLDLTTMVSVLLLLLFLANK